jgi:CarD family transcriptional regulator
MYSVGDLIIYSSTGVCRVEDITERDGRPYYVLKPLYQVGIIQCPADSTKVFTRPVISRQEAEELIADIPNIHAEAYHTRVLSQLSQHYEAALKSHNCRTLIELTKSIYAKRENCLKLKKKLGAVDERFMRRAEELLFGELAAALDIEKSSVPEYISSVIEAE